jgi:PAS domain S-box-containing protein
LKSPTSTEESWRYPWYLVLLFVFITLSILVIGNLYYKDLKYHLKKEKQQELAAIVSLKIDQIISWRQEQIDFAGTIVDDPFIALRVRDFFTKKKNQAIKEQLIERLTGMIFYEYQSLALIDPQGKIRLEVRASGETLSPYLKSLAMQAMREKRIVFSDLYRDEDSKVTLSILTPLLVVQRKERIIVGVILLRIEPYQFLYPLIKSWPTPSLTGETVLIRREGKEVVFLNELRHRQNIPLNLRLPLNSPHLVAAKVARGEKGMIEGLDYRGVPVLAASAHIPDTSWFLIAKLDADETFAPLKKRTRELSFLLISLITCGGLGVAYFWRNQQIRFYRRQYEVERQRRSLAQRYEYLTRFANDIILVTDRNLKIVEANDRAVAIYGYQREELLQLDLKHLYPPRSEPFLNTLVKHVEEKSGLIFETLQQRKDGTIFPVEVSLRLLEVEGEELFQEIIRDITERKRSEEVLKESERNLRYLASRLLTAQEDERKRISRELHDELGHALLTLKLQLASVVGQLTPQQISLKDEINKILKFIGSTIEEVRRLYLDLTPGDLEDLGLATALHSLIDDFASLQKHIKWTISIDDLDGLLSLPIQTAIYRVVQEALTNIGKYARPKNVLVEIKRLDQSLFFTIQDNGIGFERGQVLTEKKTLGLLAMEERVKILGGSFELWSRKNQGTKISFSIPIPGGN